MSNCSAVIGWRRKQSSQPKSVTPAQERYDLNGLHALVNHFAK
ncbi:hypothetical protein [Shewanella sp. WXL01]|nr:hypothetical protein [Shewanella sp. WXL01]